ncbi:hypothetical protein D082_01700 [Synechocystis sp. PCC 6714]|nr:hypothetical protein D082_01700 [Synechocystis sp. PCC 6714]
MPSILGDRRLNRRLTPRSLCFFRDKVGGTQFLPLHKN